MIKGVHRKNIQEYAIFVSLDDLYTPLQGFDLEIGKVKNEDVL